MLWGQIIFEDGDVGTAGLRLRATTDREYIAFRHLDAMNMLFVDNHVESLKFFDTSASTTAENWTGGTD